MLLVKFCNCQDIWFVLFILFKINILALTLTEYKYNIL